MHTFLNEDTKASRFNTFLENSPLPTNETTQKMWRKLGRVWGAQNPFRRYDFKTLELRDDYQDYLEAVKIERFMQKEVWSHFQTSPNDFVVIDLPSFKVDDEGNRLQSTEKPEPKPCIVGIHSVIDYLNSADKTEYIIYEIEGAYITIDDISYKVTPLKDGDPVFDQTIEIRHDLGFAPCFQISRIKQRKNDNNLKMNPVTASLSELDMLLFTKISKRYLGTYMWPIIQKLKEGCDYRDPQSDNECVGGLISGYLDADDGSQGEYYERQCPSCAKNKLVGPGTVMELDLVVPGTDTLIDLEDVVKFITPDHEFLKYTDDAMFDKESEIIANVVGTTQESNNDKAKNEKQVESQFEDRKEILIEIAKDMAVLEKEITSTMAIFRYRDSFLGCEVSNGTEFFLQTVGQLQERLKVAMESGASQTEIMELKTRMIQTENMTNPDRAERQRILLSIEPAPSLEIKDAKLLLPDHDFVKKLNFHNFVERFEREQGPINEFLPNASLAQRVNVIDKIINSYVKSTERSEKEEGPNDVRES